MPTHVLREFVVLLVGLLNCCMRGKVRKKKFKRRKETRVKRYFDADMKTIAKWKEAEKEREGVKVSERKR